MSSFSIPDIEFGIESFLLSFSIASINFSEASFSEFVEYDFVISDEVFGHEDDVMNPNSKRAKNPSHQPTRNASTQPELTRTATP